jgi:hypothetical protein
VVVCVAHCNCFFCLKYFPKEKRKKKKAVLLAMQLKKKKAEAAKMRAFWRGFLVKKP